MSNICKRKLCNRVISAILSCILFCQIFLQFAPLSVFAQAPTDIINIASGIKYTTNWTVQEFVEGHEDLEYVKLTDETIATSSSAIEIVGFVNKRTAENKDDLKLNFKFPSDQQVCGVSLSGWVDQDNMMFSPSNYKFEYLGKDGQWTTLKTEGINNTTNGRYTVSFTMENNLYVQTGEVRLCLTIPDNQSIYIDEVEVWGKDNNVIPPKGTNILLNVPYTTTLADGDANNGQGNFHGDHPDLERKLLSDGLRASNWEDPNVVLFNARDGSFTIPADVVFDLGSVKTFEQINVSCIAYAVNSICRPGRAVIMVSDDNVTWQTIYNEKWDGDKTVNKEYVLTANQDETISARYIKFNFYHSIHWMAFDEIQIFDKKTGDIADGTLTVKQHSLDSLRGKNPAISDDETKIILPESPSELYEIGLLGSDNKSIIDLDGNIHKPLVTTTVNLIYKSTLKSDRNVVEKGDYNVSVTVPGLYEKEASDNKMPDTMPSMREWKGHTGEFSLTDTSSIVVDPNADARTKQIAATITTYFKDMLKKDVIVREGTPVSGDIYIKLDSSIPEMGKEGYYMDVNNIVEIIAPNHTGLLYGGISATQILYKDKDHNNIPKGIARDYPMYEVRSGMLDVARAWIPMDYLKEITRYMAWFKMNEIHLHINDRGEGGYKAFRLESNLQNLTSKDVYYTKEGYRNYQYEALDLGVKVVTEIDTPGHSNAFAVVPGIKMFDPSHIDITDRNTVEIIKGLFDEYLDGTNPVIVTDTIHIGTDEFAYNKAALRNYTYELAEHVKSKGFIPRFWGGYDSNTGLPDGVASTSGVQTNYWAAGLPTLKQIYEMGYDVINSYGPMLYTVPGGNYGFADYLDIVSLYNSWNVNWFDYNGSLQMPLGHPQTLGASFALWNDLHTSNGGIWQFDIFERFKNGIMLIAEKAWHGAPSSGQNSNLFMNRVNTFSNKVPGANPNRYVDTNTSTIAKFDFESVDGNTVIDKSDNAFNGTLSGAQVVNENGGKALSFDGTGTFGLPMKGIGFPYTAQFDVKVTDNRNTESTLFSGKDGSFYTNIDGTGKVGFKRDIYTYIFDYKLPINEWVNITIKCNKQFTTLVVDGKEYKANNTKTPINGLDEHDFSSTSILTTDKIGLNFKGFIDNLVITNPSISPVAPPENLALNCNVTISEREVPDQLGPELAVDGDKSPRSRASFGPEKDDQWLIVDLGKVQDINKIVLFPFEQAKEYKVLISETGLDGSWKEVYQKAVEGNGGANGVVDTITFDTQKARYVKYQQIKRWYHTEYSRYYSGGILELEVYNWPNDKPNVPVENVAINTEATLKVGETVQLTATVTPDNATNKAVTWNSSNEDVATVDTTGKVTAKATGIANISVITEDGGKTAICKVTVKAKDNGNDNSGGGTVTPPVQKTEIKVDTDGNVSVVTKPEVKDNNASVSLDNATVNAAFDKAQKDKAGNKTVTIAVPNTKGADNFIIELPSSHITSDKYDKNIILDTPAGAIKLTNDMFDKADINADKVQIIIAESSKDAAIKDKVKYAVDITVAVNGKIINCTPNRNIEVSIDYNPSAEEKIKHEKLAIKQINADGTVSDIINGRYDKDAGKMVFTAKDLGKYAVVFSAKSFKDMDKYGWANNPVEVLAAKGILSGTSENTFSPANNIKRGDFLLMLMRTLGLEAEVNSNFDDVSKTDYYYEAIGAAKILGITAGVGNNKFDPEAEISRQDMMVLVANAMKYADKLVVDGSEKDLDAFADAGGLAGYAISSVATLVKNGLISGNGNGINPAGTASRAEVATVMYKVYGFK